MRARLSSAWDRNVGPEPGEKELLKIENLTIRFGGVTALDGISFTVDAGQIVGLIGPNGAGKTTVFNCLSRLYNFKQGDVLFRGRSIKGVRRSGVAALGIGRTFQNLALFPTMSVRNNVLLGGHCWIRSRFLANALRLPQVRHEEAALDERCQSLLDLLELRGEADRLVAELPFGTQKRVELGRALAVQPSLLLLDEPACGLNHEEIEDLRELLEDIHRRFKMAILLVEHHMALVMRLSHKVVTLDFGRKIADGPPEVVQRDVGVLRAYLGTH